MDATEKLVRVGREEKEGGELVAVRKRLKRPVVVVMKVTLVVRYGILITMEHQLALHLLLILLLLFLLFLLFHTLLY